VAGENGEMAVVARNLGVQYDLRLTPDRTLRRTAVELIRHGWNANHARFWALRDVNLDLSGGETIGVVGPNGSGKSTLLLLIAGILRPDSGFVRSFGQTPTLLTLQAGFESDLNGRQNIYLNAAYLGFSRAETAQRMPEIVEFSELGAFIDAPVRQYSAGMRVRLAFSIVVHTQPHILLLDEVLAVGDVAFQRKSQRKIMELMGQASAIIVVSHNVGFINETCTRAIWLDEGRVRMVGAPADVTDAYLREAQRRKDAVRVVETQGE
jgi:ABC-type polysaccharide/polyol phosphate transport system ATPase subunit